MLRKKAQLTDEDKNKNVHIRGCIHRDGAEGSVVSPSVRCSTFITELAEPICTATQQEDSYGLIKGIKAKNLVVTGTDLVSDGTEDGAVDHRIRVAKGAESGVDTVLSQP